MHSLRLTGLVLWQRKSRLDIGSGSNFAVEPAMLPQFASPVIECKCGMPLCICEAPSASEEVLAPPPKPSPTVTTSSNLKPKRTDTGSRNKDSTSNTNHGTTVNYEANEEGAREAIKNGDTAALQKLLNEVVDAMQTTVTDKECHCFIWRNTAGMCSRHFTVQDETKEVDCRISSCRFWIAISLNFREHVFIERFAIGRVDKILGSSSFLSFFKHKLLLFPTAFSFSCPSFLPPGQSGLA